ncbi:MAG: hypothetical protein KGI57_08200 [Hyphomicrobiales bacterium]|nr:hypothetical protein [Hyphomicrobiales bacterium]MDE2017672.1 hypothetical protein [Hyphomicrobiales bacterium]
MLNGVLSSYIATHKNEKNEIDVIIPKLVFDYVLAAALSSVRIDERWYVSKYDDVRKAIESGHIKSAKHHFISSGYAEGRLPYHIKVDEDFYLRTNKDVADALKNKTTESAQSHFEIAGYSEGRLPYPAFKLF